MVKILVEILQQIKRSVSTYLTRVLTIEGATFQGRPSFVGLGNRHAIGIAKIVHWTRRARSPAVVAAAFTASNVEAARR